MENPISQTVVLSNPNTSTSKDRSKTPSTSEFTATDDNGAHNNIVRLAESSKDAGHFPLDENVVAAFPDDVSEILNTFKYGESLWGVSARIDVLLASRVPRSYFLKVVELGDTGRSMCQGEFESLKTIAATCPGFCPNPYAWGKYASAESTTHFLLSEYREIGRQPAEPMKLAAGLAELHAKSQSPTGKFGYHVRTCHARISQAVDFWDDSWCTVFSSHLGHVIDVAKPILNWREFEVVAALTLKKVVPRLLLPLQENGRILKPSLVHGNCWDGNTATDAKTGQAFVFDVCSFYGHNEYDTGNWRAPRHRLSDKAYIQNYKKIFPASEPVGEWDARNLLYSLPYNIGNAIYVPGSNQREVIFEDMKTLCTMFCEGDLVQEMKQFELKEEETTNPTSGDKSAKQGAEDEDEEEEEEEEEEED